LVIETRDYAILNADSVFSMRAFLNILRRALSPVTARW